MEENSKNNKYKGIDSEMFSSDEKIFSWIEGLTQFPHRRTGTIEGAMSANYLKQQFESIGLSNVSIEEAASFYYETTDYSLSVNGIDMPCFYINGTLRKEKYGVFEVDEEGKNREVVFLGEGKKEDFENVDVRNKIVICDCPWFDASEEIYAENWCTEGAIVYDPDKGERAKLKKKDTYSPNAWPYNYIYAMEKGAIGFVGVLVDYFDDGINWNEDYTEIIHSFGYEYFEIAGLWVGNSTGNKIKQILTDSTENVYGDIHQKTKYEMRTAKNVLGFLEGKSDEIIMVHSHHDAVFTGAVQDASGVSEVLALADYFASQPKEAREKTLLFAALDSHYTDYNGHIEFLKKRLSEKKILVDIVIEHIGREVGLGINNEPVLSEFPELRIIYVSDDDILRDTTKKAVINNNLCRTIIIPVKDAVIDNSENYEFSQDEVISDAYYSHQYGIPIISMLSPQMYLFHPMDTVDMIPKQELKKVGITFAEIIDTLSRSL